MGIIDVFVVIAIFGFMLGLVWKRMYDSKSPLAIKIMEYINKPKDKIKDMKDTTEQIYHEKREIM